MARHNGQATELCDEETGKSLKVRLSVISDINFMVKSLASDILVKNNSLYDCIEHNKKEKSAVATLKL